MNLFMVDLSGTMEVLFRFFQAPLNLILKTIKIKNIVNLLLNLYFSNLILLSIGKES